MENAVNIVLGCKSWTRGSQFGFRVYADDIKGLVPVLVYPSSDGQWPTLSAFYEEILAGQKPRAYARSVLIRDGRQSQVVAATFAWHSGTVQGYITAPRGTWLHDYVSRRLSRDLECEYLVQRNQDLILIPRGGDTVERDLKRAERAAVQKIRTELKRRGWAPPPKAREIGLYFELLEYERLTQAFPAPDWNVNHRYPLIDSQHSLLRRNDISCDIDVITRKQRLVRCVEVKSVSGAPGSPFHISPREWRSREWCRARRLEYEVVVYYHAGFESVQRIEIPRSVVLTHEPSGYWCYPD